MSAAVINGAVLLRKRFFRVRLIFKSAQPALLITLESEFSAGLIGWSDWIFVMEKKHEQALRRKYSDDVKSKRLICLHIQDQYHFMDSELIEILRSRVSEHLLI